MWRVFISFYQCLPSLPPDFQQGQTYDEICLEVLKSHRFVNSLVKPFVGVLGRMERPVVAKEPR